MPNVQGEALPTATGESMIFTGVWRVFPERGFALNCHNGTAAYIEATTDGYVVWGVNIPADYMLRQLAEWVASNMMPSGQS